MILDTLAAAAKVRVVKLEKVKSLAELRAEAEQIYKKTSTGRKNSSACRVKSFLANLQRPGLNFICECKKASPSKGLISPKFPYLDIAKAYERGGASAVSVLTEPEYFLGSDLYLQEIAAQINLPVLRKDFTVSPYQIYEAKTLGASSVLLICAILSASQLEEYRLEAESIGLDALVETHDGREIETALKSGARIIGINNRNLKDFTVDIRTCLQLRKEIPIDCVCIAESGIRNEDDIRSLKSKGFNGVLIGETLMRNGKAEERLRKLRKAWETYWIVPGSAGQTIINQH